ncbi:MAG: transcriptional repressor LexA [Desulfuromonadaceae bacterium]|nr:transcriptional repressor LexA [Desulfuromonadaceae bacterium]
MQPLTDRQQQVLDFITSYFDRYGSPPTLREISGHIGTKGTATAIAHLEALERKGYLSRREGSSRSISLAGRSGSVAVPIIGRVRAGQPTAATEDIQGYCSVDTSWVNEQGCFFLRVEGDSMIGAHILDGDLVLIRPQQSAENGQIVVAMIDGEATLKRFYREKDQIRLQPENSTMEPIIIRAGEAETVIVGKLLKSVRNYP